MSQSMIWELTVAAEDQRRILARIIQVLDNQMVAIRSFSGHATHGRFSATFVIGISEDKVRRIETLLYKLDGLQYVEVSSVL
jgi:(p)ppGpp synthase/HD superfamily hydrolase